MAVQLDWPSDVVDRLTEEARKRGRALNRIGGKHVATTAPSGRGSVTSVESARPGTEPVRNSVLMGLRRGRISRLDSERFPVSLNGLNVRLGEPASYDDVFSLAQEHGLPVYMPPT